MKKMLFGISILCLFVIFASSCGNEEMLDETNELVAQKSLKAATLELKNDTIIPLDEDDFPEVEKKELSRGYYDLWEDLYQLNGIEFFIQSKDTYFSKNSLETNGKGKELKIAAHSPTNKAQMFYLKYLPASSGIPYLIYSFKENVPIGVGRYTNNPKKRFI